MKKEFRNSLRFPLLFVFCIGLIHLLKVQFELSITDWGVFPLEAKGLKGILLSPFVHGSWEHLFNNSIPLLILGTALFFFYKKLAYKVWIYSIVFTGILLWLGGRPSYHIGASGLVYALASFLFLSGLLRKQAPLMATSLLVVFIYGGLVWGIFPSHQHISWEGHLFGAVNGLFWAIYFRKEGPAQRKYSWDYEAEALDKLDGLEVIYEEITGKDDDKPEEPSNIIYDYKPKK